MLLRPRRTVTHFLRETHYPHEVTAAVRLVAVEDDSYRLVQALFQSGECVGVQECLMGAWAESGWAASRWVALPEAARRALAAEQVDGQPLLPWPELPEETETFEPGPRQVALTARYADLDPDRRLSELAQARYLEQARAGSVTMLRQPNLGLLVARCLTFSAAIPQSEVHQLHPWNRSPYRGTVVRTYFFPAFDPCFDRT